MNGMNAIYHQNFDKAQRLICIQVELQEVEDLGNLLAWIFALIHKTIAWINEPHHINRRPMDANPKFSRVASIL